jgi:hypothetical protein
VLGNEFDAVKWFGAGRPTTKTMYKSGTEILGQSPSAEDMKAKPLPGDLVLMSTPSDIHHVGMCLGNNTGQYIHAPKTGDVVKISELAGRSDIAGIRRYLPETSYSSGAPGSGISSGSLMDITNGTAISVDELKKLLGVTSGGDKILQYADQISEAAARFGVNPLFSIAQSAHETGWWTSKAFKEINNIGGLSKAGHMYSGSGISAIGLSSEASSGTYAQTSRWAVFNTPGDSFQAKIWLIAEHGYFNEGRTTIAKVIEKYAPAGENNVSAYVKIVEDNMRSFCKKLGLNPDEVR